MTITDFEEEIKKYTSDLKLAKKEGDKFKEGDSLENLAICYSVMPGHEDLQKAVDYYNQAINIFLQFDWVEMFYKASASLGMVYEKLLHDPDSALRVYEYALDQGEKNLVFEVEEYYREECIRAVGRLKNGRS